MFIKHVVVRVEKQRKVEKKKTLSDMQNYLWHTFLWHKL